MSLPSSVGDTNVPGTIQARRAPTSSDTRDSRGAAIKPGREWSDNSQSPSVLYTYAGNGNWVTGGNEVASSTTYGIVILTDDDTANDPVATKTYADNLAIAGAPVASDVTQGIAFTATDAQCVAGTANTITEAYMVSPDSLAAIFAEPNASIGGTTPVAGTFTDLTADGTGQVSLGSNAAGDFTVTGASTDLTLESVGGSVNVLASEAAANAVRIYASDVAGGIDVDCGTAGATLDSTGTISLDAAAASNFSTSVGDLTLHAAGACNLTSAETNSDSINVTSAGGMNIVADGAAGKDIVATCTSGSIHLTAGEAVSDAVNIDSSGGVDVNASGQINLASSQNAADAVVVEATAGGVQILASSASAGEDIVLTATGSSVSVTATEDAALNIYLHANGGTSETIDIHSDQGTGVASVNVHSDVGGLTFTSGLASADAINITATDAAGGIDIDSGTAGFIINTTGAVSLDSAAASNFTVTGAFDLTAQSTAGSILLIAGEAVADALNFDAASGGLDVNVGLQMNLDSAQAAVDAVRVIASDLAGGIDVDAGTGGITIDTTGTLSFDSAGATNLTATGAFDVTVNSTAGSVIVNGEEAVDDAIQLTSAAGGLAASVALSCVIASTETNADSVQLTSAGGMVVTAAGAAAKDLDLVCTSGSVNITAGENVADSVTVTCTGMDVAITGAAGQDFDLVNTGGSVNITASESAADAVVITASGAAGAIQLKSGTGGVVFDSGITVDVLNYATGTGTPYAVLGSDYLISTDTTGGALTLTLPAAPATGRKLIVYDGAGQAATGGAITIDGNGKNIAASGTSAATKALSAAYSSMELVYNGTLWCGRYVA